MAKLLIRTEGLGIQALELQMGVNHVGRSPDCEQCLNHHTVSSLHCELSLTHDGVYVRECNSTNGTFIDDVRISRATILPVGSILRLGEVKMRHALGDGRIGDLPRLGGQDRGHLGRFAAAS